MAKEGSLGSTRLYALGYLRGAGMRLSFVQIEKSSGFILSPLAAAAIAAAAVTEFYLLDDGTAAQAEFSLATIDGK